MTYEDAFIAGFQDELEKLGGLRRGLPREPSAAWQDPRVQARYSARKSGRELGKIVAKARDPRTEAWLKPIIGQMAQSELAIGKREKAIAQGAPPGSIPLPGPRS